MTHSSTPPAKRWKDLVLWGVIGGLFIAELLFYTWSRVQCVQIGYMISKQNRLYEERTTLRNNLRIELARLKSPDRITKIVRRQRGLVMPKSEQTIILP